MALWLVAIVPTGTAAAVAVTQQALSFLWAFHNVINTVDLDAHKITLSPV